MDGRRIQDPPGAGGELIARLPGEAVAWPRLARGLAPLALLVLLAAPLALVGSSAEATLDRDEAADMPRLLSVDDVRRYERLFELQRAKRWRAADEVARQLDDPILLGHLLYERYLHPNAYRSKFEELRRWLANYHDHPGAERVYRLAMKRRPKRAGRPRRPTTTRIPRLAAAPPVATERAAARYTLAGRARRLAARVLAGLKRDRPTWALKLLKNAHRRQALGAADYDTIASAISRSYYYNGKYRKALKLAAGAAERSRARVQGADWFAGLAAWRLGDHETARRHFDALANSETASGDMVAAGAYWAARTSLVGRRPNEVIPYLSVAGRHPKSFYGLVANRRLARETGLDWTPPPLSEAEFGRLLEIPAIRRIAIFREIGRHDLADREIRHLLTQGVRGRGPVLLAVADRLGMPETVLRLARLQRNAGLVARDTVLYPLAPWRPNGGWEIDRALVNAFIRRESNFRPDARSPVGASGLMQLMPRTASFMAGDSGLVGREKRRLLDPAYNIKLGQRYIAYLLEEKSIRGNLILLAMAYNGGPTKAQRWFRKVEHGGDPLLMIESVPQRETRLFIKRILTNFWIYRDRLGQDTPSLDAVASGYWPYYVALDGKAMSVAQGGRAR